MRVVFQMSAEDAALLRMAKAASGGVVPFDEFLKELETLRGESVVLQ